MIHKLLHSNENRSLLDEALSISGLKPVRVSNFNKALTLHTLKVVILSRSTVKLITKPAVVYRALSANEVRAESQLLELKSSLAKQCENE